MKMESVKPTRMELLNIRNRLSLAEKGHKLLEDKRDALVERFLKAIKERDDLRKEIDALLAEAFDALTDAEMIIGIDKVKRAVDTAQKLEEIEVYTENVMGVKVPRIREIDFKPKLTYSLSDTCARLDDAFVLFVKLVPKLLKLAEVEGAIWRLSIEIEKTKRRVNVLENILIPRLKETKKYIEMQLEEREREDFFRRKRMKAIMEKK